MRGSIFLKALRDQRRSLVGWSLGVLVYVLAICAVYPSFRGSASAFDDYLERLPEAFRNLFLAEGVDITSPVGFLNAELFSFMMPLLLLVFAIGAGARAIAGEEERGTLDLLLSYPVVRWRLVLEKFAAFTVAVVLLALVLFLSALAGRGIAGMDEVGIGVLAEGAALLGLLAWTFGTLAFAVSSVTGRRALGAAVAGVLAAVSYLLNVLGPLIEGGMALRRASLIYYAGGSQPLIAGLTWSAIAVFVSATAVLLVASVLLFARHDVRV